MDLHMLNHVSDIEETNTRSNVFMRFAYMRRETMSHMCEEMEMGYGIVQERNRPSGPEGPIKKTGSCIS